MKKLLAAVAAVAVLGAGVFALASVLPAGAQTDPGSSSSDSGPAGPHGRGARLKSVLDGLVADGTITQAQEDKILGALQAAAPRGPGKGGRLGRGAVLKQAAETTASALGISVDELKADLKAGRTVAEVASARGVPLDAVTKALTDAATTRIDQAVTDGKLTKEQADALKGRLPDAIDRFEHATLPRPGHHRGGPPPFGAGDAPGSSSSSSGA